MPTGDAQELLDEGKCIGGTFFRHNPEEPNGNWQLGLNPWQVKQTSGALSCEKYRFRSVVCWVCNYFSESSP